MKYIRIILVLIVISSLFACAANNQTDDEIMITSGDDTRAVTSTVEAEPLTVHVSSNRESDFASLEEAIEAVPPHSTLVLDA